MAVLSDRRILVVEDEASIALDLAALLLKQGARVIGPATSVNEALYVMSRSGIDCALLDVKLGQQDVSLVAQALARGGVPFIFVTGYSKHKVIGDYPAHPVIEKPYRPAAVVEAIEAVAGAPHRGALGISARDLPLLRPRCLSDASRHSRWRAVYAVRLGVSLLEPDQTARGSAS
jgi:DNA-binding response OmpR family regulator